MADCEKEIQIFKDRLLKANEEIEKLSRIKSDFISVVSHELRTPLTSIKESVSLVLDGITGPLTEEQKKFLTITKNNIERLAKLITDILDLSKIESGRLMIHKRKLDINGVIKAVYESTKLLAEQKNLGYSLSLGGPLELTWFDPERIGCVLKNLISNAIKFNKDKGKIEISSSEEVIEGRSFIKVTVEDNGIGIPKEDMENLFRYFSPLDMSMTRKQNGAGLGLAVSKGMVELHGGNMWVISEPGIGSKFIFTIPVYKRHEEFNLLIEEAIEKARHNDNKIAIIVFDMKGVEDTSEGAIAGIEDVIKKTVRGPEDKVVRFNEKSEGVVIIANTDRPGAMAIIRRLRGNISAPVLFGVSVYPDEAMDKDELMRKAHEDIDSGKNSMARRKALLIIDDEEDISSMLSFRLKNMGFDVVTASNGDRGVELARVNKPDLILLDLMMPDMDGFEVSKRLKESPATNNIPIVVFSALENKNTKESMEKLGAAGFIEKPFELDMLVNKINGVLEARNG